MGKWGGLSTNMKVGDILYVGAVSRVHWNRRSLAKNNTSSFTESLHIFT